jgi:hypothetical protein
LPELEHAKAAVLNSLNSADAKRGYCHAIDEFVDWYCSEPRLAFNKSAAWFATSFCPVKSGRGEWIEPPSSWSRTKKSKILSRFGGVT